MILEMVAGYTRNELEQIRQDAKEKFNERRSRWVEQLLWTNPHRAKHLLNMTEDKPYGYPIIDGTHILAQRSMVAGFLEGNTSASRPWIRYVHPDRDRNVFRPNREWLEMATTRAMAYLANSNFYHQAAQFYYDFASVETGAYIFKKSGRGIHVYCLMPGSYFAINNALDEPEILVREFNLSAMALVKHYGTKVNGSWDWSMFSGRVREAYEKSDTKTKFEIVEIHCRNKDFSTDQPIGGTNRQWVEITYETGVFTASGFNRQINEPDKQAMNYIRVSHSRRRPFIVGKALGDTYGEKGPTHDGLGLIRSINKKGISKDIAIEKMLDPTVQGPAHLRKPYITTQARRFIGLDATAMAQGGLKTIYEIPNGISLLTNDVDDIRRQIEKFYYADFLLFLSNNPKTRTATEAQAVVNEQQSVIGPNLQSLNWSHNMPIAEWMLDFVINEDPYLPPPPEGLQGEWINTEFISVFAQVQKAFDLPSINQYVDRWMGIAQLNPKAWDNFNLDELARVYEDRYYVPAGINNEKSIVDALRRQAQQQQMRQQMIEALPAAAQAGKDVAQARATDAQTGAEVTV